MPHSERLRSLLAQGYFPRELPPVFTTNDFGRRAHDILDEWKTTNVFRVKPAGKIRGTNKNKRGSYTYDLSTAEIENISIPKRGYERRNVHITHPIPQALLALELTKHWTAIQKWLSRRMFSLDEIRISDKHARSLKGINFDLHRTKKAYLTATSDWVVKTAISRFYPSIYTHSIAWAAYDKERVKSNISLYQGSLADRLDTLVRACNRNQTIGIPTGPETSRIIAEIISCRIDDDFHAIAKDVPTGAIDRLQDDWLVGVQSLEKAELVLSKITSTYRKYGLDINGHKTSIDHIISSCETAWISEINAFLSHRSGFVRAARLRELLALALRLQATFKTEPVINYVLSVVENQPFSASDAAVLESFLLKAAVVAPISMDRICRIILNLDFETKEVSRQRIGRRFTTLAERNLQNGNLYKVIWLLYTLRGLKIRLRSRSIPEMLEGTASGALGLIALDMASKGLVLRNLPTAAWARRITKERVLSDWIWLLAYEGIRHGWLSDPLNVMDEPFFKAMSARGVQFYDPRRNIAKSQKVGRLRRNSRILQIRETQRIMRVLRGFHPSEY